MADRQGLLKGRRLSEVQARAVYLLEVCDAGDRQHEQDLAMRQRLYASGRYEWDELFGDQGATQGPAQFAEDVEESTTRDGDAVPTRYILPEPDEEVTPESAEAMIAQMLGEMASGTSFSGADAQGGGWQ